MSQRALILGSTGKNSLGREIALAALLLHQIKPILVGRTGQNTWYDSLLAAGYLEFIKADLMDPDVGQQIIAGCGEPSDIKYLIVAGGGPALKKGTLGSSPLEVRRQWWRTITEGPMEVVEAFHSATAHAYHLITVASTSAQKIRTDETVYATAQAARRTFALNFHAELSERPGAKNLVVCPGGMRTGLWDGTDEDSSKYMNPQSVASLIWQIAANQTSGRMQITINRGPNGLPELIVEERS